MGSRRGNFRTDFVCSDDDRGVRQMERPIERLWSFNLTLILGSALLLGARDREEEVGKSGEEGQHSGPIGDSPPV